VSGPTREQNGRQKSNRADAASSGRRVVLTRVGRTSRSTGRTCYEIFPQAQASLELTFWDGRPGLKAICDRRDRLEDRRPVGGQAPGPIDGRGPGRAAGRRDMTVFFFCESRRVSGKLDVSDGGCAETLPVEGGASRWVARNIRRTCESFARSLGASGGYAFEFWEVDGLYELDSW